MLKTISQIESGCMCTSPHTHTLGHMWAGCRGRGFASCAAAGGELSGRLLVARVCHKESSSPEHCPTLLVLWFTLWLHFVNLKRKLSPADDSELFIWLRPVGHSWSVLHCPRADRVTGAASWRCNAVTLLSAVLVESPWRCNAVILLSAVLMEAGIDFNQKNCRLCGLPRVSWTLILPLLCKLPKKPASHMDSGQASVNTADISLCPFPSLPPTSSWRWVDFLGRP